MGALNNLVDIFFHIDKHLSVIIQNCGSWSYAVLFAIIFAETGLVVTPFLPGDSLLFAAGALAVVDKTFLGWVRLSFENGQTGWVRQEDVVMLWQ